MIKILKLDHRPERDKRITTHCALVARAFHAKEFYYSGIEDKRIETNIIDINDKWGGAFKVKYLDKPLMFLKNIKLKEKLIIIHLTMYGEQIKENILKIKEENKKKDILIIVGGPKVPKEYYELADFNISITNQPQSEVGALAITLYLINPDVLNEMDFKNTKIKVIPNKFGKNVINLK